MLLHVALIRDALLPIGISLVLSTLIAVAVTALAMVGFEKLTGNKGSDAP